MQSVKVSKNELLRKLTSNRSSHRALFVKAQEGYRQRVIEELDEMLEEARRGDRIRTRVSLQAPEDHTEDYDTVISMLEMSVDESIELDQHEYSAYVLNKWAWFDKALFSNSTYASGGKLSL